jgi:phenylalanyl-tRNA synthetase beta chain
MIVTKNWLSEFVNLDGISNDKLYETFNSIGLEVDSIVDYTIPQKVVVGEILSCKKHPDADKLNVCQIDVGGDTTLQIVCGASNVVDARFVAVATVGATLPNDFHIKDATLRGVESAGMVCASSELGLPDMGKGIMILDDSIGKLEVGRELSSYGAICDTTIELELTANRGDCLSIHGVARDLSVALEREMKPFVYDSTHKEKLGVARIADIQARGVIDADLRYVLANIEPIETPFLLKLRLAMVKIDLESELSNILHYSTHSTGVILRAYSAKSLKDSDDRIRLQVSSPKNGIVDISSQEQTISILGINQNSDKKATSSDSLLLLEASYIEPTILVDAVYNGEYTKDDLYYKTSRGSEPDILFGLEFAISLLEMYANGKCYEGYLNVENSWEAIRLGIDIDEVCAIIGAEITKSRVITILKALGFEVNNGGGSKIVVVIPRFRHDIVNIQDITEEIVRIVGINNIPAKPLSFEESNKLNSTTSSYKFKKELRYRASAVGFYENISYIFCDRKKLERYEFDTLNEKLDLTNPIAEELNTLRSTIIINLLDAIKRNVSYTQKSIALFEIGAVFNTLRVQQEKITMVLSGQDELESVSNSGKPQMVDFGSFVKRLSMVIGEFELVACREVNTLIHPYQSADIIYRGERCGYVSRLHPTIQEEYGIPDTIFAEIDLDALKPTHINASPISKFQGVYKDLSVVVDESMHYSSIKEAISSLDIEILSAYYPIDIYQDEKLGDQKSLTIRLFIQSINRTLEDSDIESVTSIVLEILKERCGATLR